MAAMPRPVRRPDLETARRAPGGSAGAGGVRAARRTRHRDLVEGRQGPQHQDRVTKTGRVGLATRRGKPLTGSQPLHDPHRDGVLGSEVALESQSAHEAQHGAVRAQDEPLHRGVAALARCIDQRLHEQPRDPAAAPVVGDHDAELAARAVRIRDVACLADERFSRVLRREAHESHVALVVDVRQECHQALARRLYPLVEALVAALSGEPAQELPHARFVVAADGTDRDRPAVEQAMGALEPRGVASGLGHGTRSMPETATARPDRPREGSHLVAHRRRGSRGSACGGPGPSDARKRTPVPAIPVFGTAIRHDSITARAPENQRERGRRARRRGVPMSSMSRCTTSPR